MLDISIELNDVFAELDRITNNIEVKLTAAVKECAEEIAAEEKKNTKGKLSESFIVEQKNIASFVVDNTKEYAIYVEKGRGPVRAIRAKALRFWLNGEIIFRKSVGPMAPQPFIQKSIGAAELKFPNIIDKYLK